MKKNFSCLVILLAWVSYACQSGNAPAHNNTDSAAVGGPKVVMYHGGDILTMEGGQPSYAEALLVKDGKIAFVGTMDEAMKQAGEDHQMVDLEGKTLIPAFVDPHSHYINSLSVANQVNVYPPPAGPGSTPEGIIAAIKKFMQEKQVPKGTLVAAYGYDENVMPKGQDLNRGRLDSAFPDNPVVVGHVSMHGAVLNSVALKQFGYSADYKTPPGGVVVRKPGTTEPWGLIMETAFLPVFSGLPKPTPDQQLEWSKAGQDLYAKAGITLAQDGATHLSDLQVIDRVSQAGVNKIDVVAYPFFLEMDTIMAKYPLSGWGSYHNHFKIGGIKITSDGSPQGRTAYFTTPYLTGGPGGEKNWKGEPTIPAADLIAVVKRVFDLRVPLLVHANGDAAIDLLIKAVSEARKTDTARTFDVTCIHAQFLRKDQIAEFARLKIRPSFYSLHTYYFAEAHRRNRGEKQAAYISPLRDAIDAGLHPTNHTDFVVAPLDQLFVMWSAVNRISREGKVIGPDQRITPYEALKTQTVWAAEQYGELDRRGTLANGKLADMVILDKNPLKVDPLAIKDIQIVETIKEGTSIYKRP